MLDVPPLQAFEDSPRPKLVRILAGAGLISAGLCRATQAAHVLHIRHTQQFAPSNLNARGISGQMVDAVRTAVLDGDEGSLPAAPAPDAAPVRVRAPKTRAVTPNLDWKRGEIPDAEAALILASNWRMVTADEALAVAQGWNANLTTKEMAAVSGRSAPSYRMLLGRLKQIGVTLRPAVSNQERDARRAALQARRIEAHNKALPAPLKTLSPRPNVSDENRRELQRLCETFGVATVKAVFRSHGIERLSDAVPELHAQILKIASDRINAEVKSAAEAVKLNEPEPQSEEPDMASWSRENIERVRQLYIVEERSAAEVAKAIGGVTRMAVIGIAHRQGWSRRAGATRDNHNRAVRQAADRSRKVSTPRPPKAPPVARAPKQNAALNFKRPEPKPKPEPIERPEPTPYIGGWPDMAHACPPGARKVAFVDAGKHECLWPIDEAQEPGHRDMLVCAAPALDGESYCQSHLMRARSGRLLPKLRGYDPTIVKTRSRAAA